MPSSAMSDALRDCSNTASQNSAMEENSQPQRKRPASLLNHDQDGVAPATKRSKLDANNDNDKNDKKMEEPHNQQEVNNTFLNFTPNMPNFSVESILSVPLEMLFRAVPSCSSLQNSKRKPLLTRAEARLLSKTTLLAAEMDMICQISSHALGQQVWCQEFGNSVESVPFLRSVLGLVNVIQTHVCSTALNQVENEVLRISRELASCAVALQQYSEQNWTVSESLLDAFGGDETTLSSGHTVAQHKKFLAEVEEEVAIRIQALLTPNSDTEKEDHVVVPMTQFCRELFGMEQETETTSVIEQEQQQEATSLQQEPQDANVQETIPSVDSDKNVAAAALVQEGTNPEQASATVQAEEQEEPTTSLLESSPREKDHDHSNETALLALADEAAQEHDHQWSASTVSIHSPVKKHSPMETDESEEEEEDFGEMTQGTSNAVEALTVLASGGRGK